MPDEPEEIEQEDSSTPQQEEQPVITGATTEFQKQCIIAMVDYSTR